MHETCILNLKMQWLFSHLILIYKDEHTDTIYQRFSRSVYDTPVFQECAGVRWETPRSCCPGVFLICHRAQLKLSRGRMMQWSPCFSTPYLCGCQPIREPKAAIPSFSPTPTRQKKPKTRRAAESRARRESESNPSTKGIGRADNQRHRSPLPASKVYGFVYSWATLLVQALFR